MYLIVFVYTFPQATRLSTTFSWIRGFPSPGRPGFGFIWSWLHTCACNLPVFVCKTFRCLRSPPFFIFFEPIDFFRKKSPNQAQQAPDPGFLLPYYQVSEVPYTILLL